MTTTPGNIHVAWVLGLLSAGCGAMHPPTAPPLVIVLSVDQMRSDYLDRFADLYVGGFAALNRGAVYTDGHQDHAFTQTAPGHATIATGAFPQHHGIIANEWFDRASQRRMYCVADSTTPLLGLPEEPGRSPANLRRSTIGDWAKEQNPRTKVFSIAIKDRSAITMGGKTPDDAYWYHPESGRFVTSRYYRDGYPDWVNRFNEEGIDRYVGTSWSKLLPDSAYWPSREDDFEAEGGEPKTFPHPIGPASENPTASFYEEFLRTPFADELTLAFARDLIANERLGTDGTSDILFIGLSAADYIGHRYGPFSQEIQDHFLRLDRYMGEFLAFIDSTVGQNRYVVALSGDHGVLPLPEELSRRGIESRRVPYSELGATLTEAFEHALWEMTISEQPRVSYINGVVFRFSSDSGSNNLPALRALVAARLRDLPFVVDAYTYEELQDRTTDRPGMEVFRRSFDPDRAPDVALRFRERDLLGGESTGTSHGSPYGYDTHVPVVLWGTGIAAGRFTRMVRTVDIAPTLAAILGIKAPASIDGTVLREAIGGSN